VPAAAEVFSASSDVEDAKTYLGILGHYDQRKTGVVRSKEFQLQFVEMMRFETEELDSLWNIGHCKEVRARELDHLLEMRKGEFLELERRLVALDQELERMKLEHAATFAPPSFRSVLDKLISDYNLSLDILLHALMNGDPEVCKRRLPFQWTDSPHMAFVEDLLSKWPKTTQEAMEQSSKLRVQWDADVRLAKDAYAEEVKDAEASGGSTWHLRPPKFPEFRELSALSSLQALAREVVWRSVDTASGPVFVLEREHELVDLLGGGDRPRDIGLRVALDALRAQTSEDWTIGEAFRLFEERRLTGVAPCDEVIVDVSGTFVYGYGLRRGQRDLEDKKEKWVTDAATVTHLAREA
jgi:hypothetical protein